MIKHFQIGDRVRIIEGQINASCICLPACRGEVIGIHHERVRLGDMPVGINYSIACDAGFVRCIHEERVLLAEPESPANKPKPVPVRLDDDQLERIIDVIREAACEISRQH